MSLRISVTSGKDCATASAEPSAGPLLANRGFQGGTDYASAQTATAAACSDLCAGEEACVAMTYIVSERTCYLKRATTALVDTGNMISAIKR